MTTHVVCAFCEAIAVGRDEERGKSGGEDSENPHGGGTRLGSVRWIQK